MSIFNESHSALSKKPEVDVTPVNWVLHSSLLIIMCVITFANIAIAFVLQLYLLYSHCSVFSTQNNK